MILFKNTCLFILLLNSLFVHAQLARDSIYSTEYIRGQYDKAVAKKDSAALGMAAYKLSGNLNWEQGSTSESVDLISLSLACFSAVGDTSMYHYVSSNFSEYFIEIEQFSEAEKMLVEALSYYHRQGDKRMEMHITARLADMYKKMGEKEKFSQFLQASRQLNKIVKDTLMDIIFLIHQTTEMQNQGKLDSAYLAAKQSLDLSIAFNSSNFSAVNLSNLGYINQLKNNIDSAIYYYIKAEKTAKPPEYSGVRQICFLHLSECYEMKKDYKKAFESAMKYAALSDSILNKGRTEAIDKMTLQFESKEKQAAIDLLEKEKKLSEERNRQKSLLLFGMSFLFVVVFIIVGLAIRFYYQKLKQDKIISTQNKSLDQAKIKSLENAMRLTSVKAMLEGQEKERSRIARELHDSLGGLLSTIKLQLKNNEQIVNNKNTQKISQLLDEATNEVRTIAQNLQPSAIQQLGFIPAVSDLVNNNSRPGFSPKIKLQHYNVPENIEGPIALQFYRIIQEALNNAIRHAKAHEILIQINGEENGVSILIEDDGNGFEIEKEFSGSGLKNIRKRVEFLQAELTLEATEKGTSVFVYWQLNDF